MAIYNIDDYINESYIDSFLNEIYNNDFHNVIMEMKSDPTSISIAKSENGYYVDIQDLIAYMEAAEIDDIAEALNNIIESYEDSDMDADNIHVMLDENTLFYEDYLIENSIMYEAGMKVTDSAVVGRKTMIKLTTAIKSKVKGIKGGSPASVEEYDRAINKCKDTIKRLDEELKNLDDGKLGTNIKSRLKTYVGHVINSIPYVAMATIGSRIAIDTVLKSPAIRTILNQLQQIGGVQLPDSGGVIKNLPKDAINAVKKSAIVGSNVVNTVTNRGMLTDQKAAVQYIRQYYVDLVKDLEKKRDKLK